ncbi:ubiquitin-conjugating enzyme [Nitzschia inconspicua]|uniref:Ubiquitin-conjugating enzyme n=1 Tax=Nitzschia inconspicua TaxID=303405 RepID=A0A9K3Q1P9_9STRA|nr:ubiquitin-conjugating enzyme [Nitzschia inconspicua]
MLALKKKREAEKKQAEEEAAVAAAASNSTQTPTTTSAAAASAVEPKKVSLFGIGGEKKTKKDDNTATKKTPGEIRIQKDIGELDGGKVATVTFPNPNDLTSFNVTVKPDTGYWAGATYEFVFTIPPHYPHSPPKVECKTKIYHPNIDLEGKVCLNILREDWRPVLDINSVIYGLIYLFYEPNPDDPLNHEAAELFRKDVHQFERLVNRTLRGGLLDGTYFERLV